MKDLRKKGKGLFIALEGLDGSGKTTQMNRLTKNLRNKGYIVVNEKEQTNNIIGGLIKGQLTGVWSTRQECLQLLFAADRAHHLEKNILPALDKGKVVTTDRYYYSSMAFGGLDLPIKWVKQVNRLFPKPDLAFFLDVPPKEALRRLNKRSNSELFEKKQKMAKIRENYLDLTEEMGEFKRIDGERRIKEISKEIMGIVEDHIDDKKPELKMR